jgi:hypothetical protein
MQFKATLPREQLIRALHDKVNERREELLNFGVTFDGHAYDTNDRSIKNITSVVASLGVGIPLPDGFVWRTTDNISVPHDSVSLVFLAASMLEYSNAVYSASFSIKDAISAAENPSTIPLNEGWP